MKIMNDKNKIKIKQIGKKIEQIVLRNVLLKKDIACKEKNKQTQNKTKQNKNKYKNKQKQRADNSKNY